MAEQNFTVPLGDHLFKGFIDRVDLIPGTENGVEIIVAECILHDCRHGFDQADDEGQCRDCGYRLYCG